MKIDLWKFDEKGRYWAFYFVIQRWTFMIAIDIADYDFELHIGKCNPSNWFKEHATIRESSR